MSLTEEQKKLLPHISNVTELKKEYPLMENEGLYAIGMATLDAGKTFAKIYNKWQEAKKKYGN